MLKKLFFIAAVICSLFLLSGKTHSNYKKLRLKMVKSQIKDRGINDKKVLKAMRSVLRHKFVPSMYKALSYTDRPLPIGYGQTISQPYIVALMTELLRINKKSKILEIGTGSGYQAAVLAEIAKSVYSIEIREPLYKNSKKILKSLKYNNVKTLLGDGYYGWQKYAPYDAIIVTCAPNSIPPSLIKQLKTGGIMVIPVGPLYGNQKLFLIKKGKNKKIKSKVICGVRFVPFRRSKNAKN